MSMRIKSYFADSVQEAIERARVELGQDAMLLNSKKTEPELRNLGEFEVVFGVSKAAEREARQESRTGVHGEASTALIQEIAELRKQVETIRHSVTNQNRVSASGRKQLMPGTEDVFVRLSAAGFSHELAQEIAEGVELRLYSEARNAGRDGKPAEQRFSWQAIDAALIEEVEARFTVGPEENVSGANARVVVFVGPAGAGKTTTLMKLALRWGVTGRVPLQILSTDTLRVGGSEQLAAYARIAGLPFDRVDTAAALDSALEEHRQKRLILIDTPGFGAAEMEDAAELAAFLAAERRAEVHLVLPATLQPDAAAGIAERFAVLNPSKLVLTHMDETAKAGAVLELAMRARLPLSYLTDGQQIPEDLEAASKAALTESLRQRARIAAVSAA